MANIETVYSSGLDALSNLFEVQIGLDGAVADFFDSSVRDEIIFRIQNFSVPGATTETYTIEWGSWSFDRPNGKVNSNREISFDIRLDRSYAIYQGFVNWKNAIQNEYTGVVSDVRDYSTDIVVYPITSIVNESSDYVLGSVGQGIKFEGAWVKEVGDISFDQGSGDPLELNVTFNFLRMNRDLFTPSGSSSDQGATGTTDSN